MLSSSAEKLDGYLEALAVCNPRKSESVFQKVADKFEDDLLEFEDFPRCYFDFSLKLLSDETYYSKPGLWNFLMVLGTEKHKLLPWHYAALAEQIVGSYDKYKDEDLCLAVCDFIARNYPFALAKGILDRLMVIEERKDEGLQGFVADGLRILAAEEARALKKSSKKPM